MKKVLVMIIGLAIFLSGCGNNDETINEQSYNNNESSYDTERTISIKNDVSENNVDENNINNNIDENNANSETEISSFSTKIYTPNDSARQHNIQLTCSELNETVVKSRRNIFIL